MLLSSASEIIVVNNINVTCADVNDKGGINQAVFLR